MGWMVRGPMILGVNVCLPAEWSNGGVRFIQVYSGGHHNDANWDAHGDLVKNHELHAGNTDKPIAGLLKDLKQRGLLDETLVVWGVNLAANPLPSTRRVPGGITTHTALPCGWLGEESKAVCPLVLLMNWKQGC